MKKSGLGVGVLIVVLSLFWGATHAWADIALSGVYRKGSNITEPRPVKDAYLRTVSGGFGIRNNQEVVFMHNVEIIKPFDRQMYIKAEFQNPYDLNKPFVEDTVIEAGQGSLRLVSLPIKGLKIHRSYWVKIYIYEVADRTKPVDVFLQHIKSYVDTTGPENIIKSGLLR